MNIRKLMSGIAVVALSCAIAPVSPSAIAQNTAPSRPNVVLLVLDDVGFSDLGAFGSEIHTPNIDAIARDGLRFNHFGSRAVCSATRAALLTGRNNQTVHMEDIAPQKTDPANKTDTNGLLPANVEMLPEAMRRSGYETFALGKWHLAPFDQTGEPGNNSSWPLQRGFDHFYGFIRGWTDQYHPLLVEGNKPLPTPHDPKYHLSVDLVDHAISQMTRLRSTAASKPFFMYLAFGTAHAPIQVPRPYIDRYNGVYDKGWDALRLERIAREKAIGIIPENTVLPPINPGDTPWNKLTPTQKIVYARFMQTYAGFLTHCDEQIGRLVAYLKSTGQYDNTLFIIVSDNGAAGEAGQPGTFDGLYKPNKLTPAQELTRLDELGTDKTEAQYQRPWAMAGVTPLRRYKLWPYAGGVRTPLIMSWPLGIKDHGGIRHQEVDAIDIAPTIVDVVGTKFDDVIDGKAQIPVAGKSAVPTFVNANAPDPRPVQFFELRGNRAIRDGKWRAIAMHRPLTDFSTDQWQLFDESKDFSESTDLAKVFPQKVKELKALWWSEARKYADPPVAEPPAAIRNMDRFDDAFDEPH